jgi:hypothetical protein
MFHMDNAARVPDQGTRISAASSRAAMLRLLRTAGYAGVRRVNQGENPYCLSPECSPALIACLIINAPMFLYPVHALAPSWGAVAGQS